MRRASDQSVGLKLLMLSVDLKVLFKLSFLIMCLSILGINQCGVHAQAPVHTELKLLDPISFSTEFQDDHSTLAYFNLLQFVGQKKVWEKAQVEIKLPVRAEDALLARRFDQLTNSTAHSDVSQLRGFLPALDYGKVGTLESSYQLTNPIWVVWVPNVSSHLTVYQRKALAKILNNIREQTKSEALLFLFTGRLQPRLVYSISRIADINIKDIELLQVTKKSKRERKTKDRSPLKISASGLGELLKATQLHYTSISEQHFHKNNYNCGRACREMIPTVRIITMNEGDFDLPLISPPSQHIIFESTKHPQHLLYRPHLYVVDVTHSENNRTAHPPKWLEQFSQINSPEHQIVGHLDEVTEEIKQLELLAKSTYHSVPPIAIAQYFWGQERVKISTRITYNEKALVQDASLLLPFGDQRDLKERRLEAYREYTDRLEGARKRFTQPRKLSFVTRIFIGVLWVGFCCAALSVIVIRLRKNRSLTSQPVIDEELHLPTEALPPMPNVSQSISPTPQESAGNPVNQQHKESLSPPPHNLNPAEYARTKRQERERSLKINKPSQASPMVDPDDPSTVPAPVVEAKVSDQPAGTPVDHISKEPKELTNPADSPAEQLELMDDVLVLDSKPSESTSVHQSEYTNELNMDSNEDVDDFSDVITLNTLPIAGLYAENGPMRRYFFLIYQSPTMVGRNPNNHCALPPDGPRSDRQVSREHFELSLIEDQRWEVRCTSAQGMKLNGREVTRGESALIRDRDLLVIGETCLRFRCSTIWRTHQVKEHLKLLPAKDIYGT